MRSSLLNAFICVSQIHASFQFHAALHITFSPSRNPPAYKYGSSLRSDPDENDDKTLEVLENELLLIEALEERNKAQIYSFVDEQDQLDSMDESERELLLRKDAILEQLKDINSKLE